MRLTLQVCPHCQEQRGGLRCIDCGTRVEAKQFMDFDSVQREIDEAIDAEQAAWND